MGMEIGAVATLRPHFAAKIEASEDCWIWRGPFDPDGYGVGQLSFDGKRVRGAHRAMYMLVHGEIPDGLHIHHTCGVRACVNPDHLEALTPRDNVLRVASWPQRNSRKTHCERGHPFDEKNTYLCPDGERGCRTCRNAASARYYRRRKGGSIGS